MRARLRQLAAAQPALFLQGRAQWRASAGRWRAAAPAAEAVKGQPAVMALKRGSLVQLGNCTVKVKEQLSEGGFAYVLRARDATGKREFALKQINCGDSESRVNAQAELRLMQNLPPHPNIVSLIDTGTSKDGAVLLLMELCTGGPMSDRIVAKRRWQWEELLDAFGQITAAVVHLHAQTPPIAHRDLKIENVVLGADGCVQPGATTAQHCQCAAYLHKAHPSLATPSCRLLTAAVSTGRGGQYHCTQTV